MYEIWTCALFSFIRWGQCFVRVLVFITLGWKYSGVVAQLSLAGIYQDLRGSVCVPWRHWYIPTRLPSTHTMEPQMLLTTFKPSEIKYSKTSLSRTSLNPDYKFNKLNEFQKCTNEDRQLLQTLPFIKCYYFNRSRTIQFTASLPWSLVCIVSA
jgi:hypothetical protein